MNAVRENVNLTADQLLQAVRQLPPAELDKFVLSVNRLRSVPQVACLSPRETELLLQINQTLPAETLRKYERLYGKWRRGAVSDSEREELLRLNQQIEAANALRLNYLAELAQIRQQPLRLLMEELGIMLRDGGFSP